MAEKDDYYNTNVWQMELKIEKACAGDELRSCRNESRFYDAENESYSEQKTNLGAGREQNPRHFFFCTNTIFKFSCEKKKTLVFFPLLVF